MTSEGWNDHTLLHHLMVIHCITDIDVRLEWYIGHRGIEIEDIRG